MTTSYGTDVSTFPDLDPSFKLVDSPVMVCQCTLRRWTTPRGSLDYDPEAGLDVRQFLNADIDNTQLYALRNQMVFEAEKDERVLTCSVALTFANNSLTITATLTLSSNQSFVLVANVSALTVTLLSVTPT